MREKLIGRFECVPILSNPFVLHLAYSLEAGVSRLASIGDLYNELFSRSLCVLQEAEVFEGPRGSIAPYDLACQLATEMRRRGKTSLDFEDIDFVLARTTGLGLDWSRVRSLCGISSEYFFRIGANPEGIELNFLHSSFGEYLSAVALCKSVRVLCPDGKPLPQHRVGRESVERWWESFDYILSGRVMGSVPLSFFADILDKEEIDKGALAKTLFALLVRYYAPAGMMFSSGIETGEDSYLKPDLFFANYWRLAKSIAPKGSFVSGLRGEEERECVGRALKRAIACDVSGAPLESELFRRFAFSYQRYYELKCNRARFEGCVLKQAVFNRCDFSEAIFYCCIFERVVFKDCRFSSARFVWPKFSEVKFFNCVTEEGMPIKCGPEESVLLSSEPGMAVEVKVVDDRGRTKEQNRLLSQGNLIE